MIDVYTGKGIPLEDATEVVDLLLNSSEQAFLDVMMIEELGIMPKEVGGEAWKSGLITFGAFMILGGIPMLPYLFSGQYREVGRTNGIFGAAVALFAIALFVLGAYKGKITGKSWWKSGLMILLNGCVTTLIGYGLGIGLEGAIH